MSPATEAEQVIKEDNMLEALGIVETYYCKCLIQKAAQLDQPKECSEEISEAAARVIFGAKWCSDLPELQFTRDILADMLGEDFAAAAKEGTALVDPMAKKVIFVVARQTWYFADFCQDVDVSPINKVKRSNLDGTRELLRSVYTRYSLKYFIGVIRKLTPHRRAVIEKLVDEQCLTGISEFYTAFKV